MKYIIILVIMCTNALARPVGYKGSINGLSFTKGDRNENTLHYSPEYNYSFGLKNFSNNDLEFNGFYASYLLKRWNFKEAQSNIFTYGSIGFGNDQLMNNYGLQLDYETRRIYTLYSYQAYNSDNISFKNHTIRLGFAPYKAGFNDINIWLIGEYNSLDKNITPILRSFYKNVLWEIGYNRDEEVLFNLMFQIMI